MITPRFIHRTIYGVATTVVLLFTMGVTFPVSASVIISNLPATQNTQVCCLTTTRSAGTQFTMPSGGDYNLDSAQLLIQLTSSTASSSSLIVGLYSDVAGQPNASLLTFVNSSPVFNGPTGGTLVMFTPPSPFTLLESTTYWLVASSSVIATTSEAPDWRGRLTAPISTGPATQGIPCLSSTAGLPPTGTSLCGTNNLIYAINGTVAAVPEPTTLALMGLGLAGIGYKRHRSKIVAKKN